MLLKVISPSIASTCFTPKLHEGTVSLSLVVCSCAVALRGRIVSLSDSGDWQSRLKACGKFWPATSLNTDPKSHHMASLFTLGTNCKWKVRSHLIVLTEHSDYLLPVVLRRAVAPTMDWFPGVVFHFCAFGVEIEYLCTEERFCVKLGNMIQMIMTLEIISAMEFLLLSIAWLKKPMNGRMGY